MWSLKLLLNILMSFQSCRKELCDKPTEVEFDEYIAMYQYVQTLLKFCLENKVDVIANQKVVDIEFIETFRENGILVLPRLGTKGIQSLQKLLQVPRIIKSIGELQNTQTIQILDELKFETLADKNYLSFQNSKANHCTLIGQVSH